MICLRLEHVQCAVCLNFVIPECAIVLSKQLGSIHQALIMRMNSSLLLNHTLDFQNRMVRCNLEIYPVTFGKLHVDWKYTLLLTLSLQISE